MPSKVFLAVLALATKVQANWYISILCSSWEQVLSAQSIWSWDRQTLLSFKTGTENGYPMTRVIATHPFAGVFSTPVANATKFGVSSDGRFMIQNATGIQYFGTPQPTGEYCLRIDSKSNAYIVSNSTGQITWQSGLNTSGSDWGFKSVTGGTFLPLFGNFNNSKLFIMDGGTSVKTNFFETPSAHKDSITNVVNMMLSLAYPPSQVQLTALNSNVFTEVDFVNAVAAVIKDTTSTSVTKVINFSGAFDNGNSQVANCAIQWAFKSGAYFIAAAGNQNMLLSSKNPYQLLVGSGYVPALADGTAPTSLGLSMPTQRIGLVPSDLSTASTAYLKPLWNLMFGGPVMVYVDLDGPVTCGTTSIGEVFCADKTIYHEPNWFKIPGTMKQVSVSAGRLYGVDFSGYVYYASNYALGNWVRVSGSLLQVDFDGNVICGINLSGRPVCADNSLTSPKWTLLSGTRVQIAVSQGRLYSVDSSNIVYYSPSYKTVQWTGVVSGLKEVRFDYGVVCGIAPNGGVWCADNSLSAPIFLNVIGNVKALAISNGRMYSLDQQGRPWSSTINWMYNSRYFGKMILPLDYSLSFEITPFTVRRNGYNANIIHLSATNNEQFGNPEISFLSSTTQIRFRMTCLENKYWTIDDPTVLPLNQATKVTLIVNRLLVQVWINGTMTSSKTLNCQRIVSSTHVWAPSNMYPQADALLGNLRIGSTLLAVRPIYQNAWIADYFVYRDFDLSFNLTLQYTSPVLTNVLSYSPDNTTSNTVPGIFVVPGTSKLMIEFRNSTYSWSITTGQIITGTTTTVAPATQLALNKNTLVRLTLQSGQLNVWLDGVLAASSAVPFSWNGGTAALYLGDMTNVPAPALISDVLLNNITTVGGLSGYADPISSYGPAIDIWSPTQINDNSVTGTSIATAVVTAGINVALNRWTNELAFNPGRGYKYLTDLARTDILNVSDPKVVASNGNNKYLDFRKIPTQPPALGSLVPTPAPDYCSALGLTTVDWTALATKASPLNKGQLVATFGTSLSASGMFMR